MKHIVSKILHQSRYDGFVRFIDGNRFNYIRNNIEPVNFKQAIKSIGSSDVTDWDANLSSVERENVLTKRDIFDETLARVLECRGDIAAVGCLNLTSSVNVPDKFKNNKCTQNCIQICNQTHSKTFIKMCNKDIFLL